MLRKQSEYLCVFLHTVVVLFIGPLLCYPLFLYLLYHGSYLRYSAIAYVTLALYKSKKEERNTVRYLRLPSVYFKSIQSYFPIVVHNNLQLPSDKNYLAGIHPHGFLPYSFSIYSDTQSFPNIFGNLVGHLVSEYVIMFIPFLRDYLYSIGALAPSEKSILRVLNNPGGGNIVALSVGGAKEVFYNNQHALVLKDKKDFCRIALESGATLLPSYAFGENDLFTFVQLPKNSLIRRVQDYLYEKFNFPVPIIRGSGRFQYMFVMPRRRRIDVVFGEPIHVERVLKPSKDQIEKLHGKYVESVRAIFDGNKVKFGINCNEKLMIV